MLFPSLAFIYIFLPVFLILYFINRSSLYRNLLLLIGSLVFYAWGEPVFVLMLMAMILVNWGAALWIEKHKQASQPHGTLIAAGAIALNLLPLVFLKVITTSQWDGAWLQSLRAACPKLSFPLGISFFTFSAIAYIVDVNRDEIKAEHSLLRVANYMAFFPKLLQGPITRYADIQEALQHPHSDANEIAEGARRFIMGLAKKVIIADNLAVVVRRVFEVEFHELSAGLAWYGLLAFAIQIYLDFSGYSDMAIGLGSILGFKLPENFNYPYLSRSIADFWRRWHMSLMNFFRTYIFMPLEIARRKERHFRQQSNLLIVFLVTGFWHGISGNFILWGLYFGVISVLEATFLGKWLKKLPAIAQNLYALALILFGWVFFKIEAVASWGPFFKALFGLNAPSPLVTLRTLNILMYLPLFMLGLIASTPLLKAVYERLKENQFLSILTDAGLIALFILCTAITVSGSYQAFLYSEF